MWSREAKLQLLSGCLDIPVLNTGERNILTQMVAAYQVGEEADWGNHHRHLGGIIINMFNKLRDVVNVQKS